MNRVWFRDWFSHIDELPAAQRLTKARRSKRLARTAGLSRARRIAGATASWRRFGKCRTGLTGLPRPTGPSFSRAARGAEAEPQAAPARREGPRHPAHPDG